MIVVRITSQLANQMFAYASIKTIAYDNGYEFRYIHEHCAPSEKSFGSEDKKYGSDFDTIFSIAREDELRSVSGLNLKVHEEEIYIKKYDSFYYEDARKIEDNTFMKGHFISPKYFYHRIDLVRDWFAFPEDINDHVDSRIRKLKDDNVSKKLVAVHFRVGNDYLLQGFLMDKGYWFRAAERMIKIFKDVKFVVFYDKKNDFVIKFLDKFDCEEVHESLVEDLCFMSKCDAQIISNSTYSMIAALLNKHDDLYVIRPSHYFTGPWSQQKNCFLDSWDNVPSDRNLKSRILSILKLGSIRNRLYNFWYYRKNTIQRGE